MCEHGPMCGQHEGKQHSPPQKKQKKPARSLSLSCAGSWEAFGVSCDKKQQRGLWAQKTFL